MNTMIDKTYDAIVEIHMQTLRERIIALEKFAVLADAQATVALEHPDLAERALRDLRAQYNNIVVFGKE